MPMLCCCGILAEYSGSYSRLADKTVHIRRHDEQTYHFTLVGNEARSPERSRNLSPTTGHHAEILDV